MSFDSAEPRYPIGEEVASSVIHAIGLVLSIAGLAVLVAFSAMYGGTRAVVASSVFGGSLILLYAASTLYHAIPGSMAKRVLRTCDHIAIFLLIAGTYTPFTLLALPGAWGWGLLVTIWSVAIIGSLAELGLLKRYRKAAVAMYVAMGWVAVVAIEPLRANVPTGGLLLLLAGGLCYTGGVPFYMARKMPYHHAIWHVFVLAGSVLHYLAILLYVIPDAPGH
ncbi:MAG: hemolysin III family protein [Luteibacter sp.]|uniref:PAQR family membrane homeostasis protein TrhA n=1 Tax=Luteibacter sp. TaxID=1886636 RepID=UPI00280A4483|nr:hemolysin III family protein [Luteibacter sp.]MDQ7996341.1 hemolysin III family protein [Luteibacter sp.]MDQ8048031.1 hemolysin III family protein [Luteibacter sp.]